MTSGASQDGPLAWNVAGLLGDAPGAERVHPVGGVTIDLGEDLHLAAPIEGQVRLVRTNRGILAGASLHTALALTCSRCLRDIELPVDIQLQEEYLPSLDLTTGRPLPTDEEPEVAAPDRPSRARPGDARPRGDPAGRADRAVVPAGLPGPVRRLR